MKDVQAVQMFKTGDNGGRCACYLRGVREVSHIPHPIMRVTVHSYNGQYRLQFVVDRFEQAFKFQNPTTPWRRSSPWRAPWRRTC